MNVEELLTALRDAGVNEWWYGIFGDTASGGRSGDGSIYLKPAADGRWEQGAYERGVATPERYFDSEDEACQYVYEQLMIAARRRPRKLTDAEREQASRAAQRLEEEFERAQRQYRKEKGAQ